MLWLAALKTSCYDSRMITWWMLLVTGVGIGVASSFTGLGGGFLIVPLLLWIGLSGPQAVGTSTMAILIIISSAVIAHHRLGHVDYRTAALIGVGGILGAQLGAHLVSHVSIEVFRKIFAGILAALSLYLFFRK